MLKQTKLWQELKKIVINSEGSYLSLRGNPTDKVMGPVTKSKFHLKFMEFVANFEKIVLGS